MSLPLFVYGTLRRGQVSHELMAGAPYLGPARTPPIFELIEMDWYPAMLAEGRTTVVGELYAVEGPLLAQLDDYEECPAVYQRLEIELFGGARAQAYVLRPEHGIDRPRIPSGDWCRR